MKRIELPSDNLASRSFCWSNFTARRERPSNVCLWRAGRGFGTKDYWVDHLVRPNALKS
jgi:hypothetical protein